MEPRFLERALELAERGRGTTHPNPVVGAVVVAGDEVVGEGWHERKGGPHAEVVALEAAGERARGATLYVTLEPCAHHGATPPCVDALVAAGVARVVAGQRDPNPEHGGGLERLREAGVEVELVDGELGFRGRQQNEAWRTWVASGRPFVTYKVAITLDGRVARAGRALGHGRGVAPARARAARRVGRGRGRHGHGALRTTRASTRATSTPRGSRGGSRSAAARCRTARSSSCARARSRRSSTRSPREASSRCCSRAGRRSPPRSSRPASSTSCSSSSRRSSPATGRAARRAAARRSSSRAWRRAPVGEDVLLQAYVHEP